ncbi:MAG TPA: hypothetical protein VHN98_08340 [Acidimicrobiales bacterium]|nr:hypothetical protein [Acidimicrobiales bacterium]
MAATDLDKPFKLGERVILNTDDRGVPEGTPGRVKVADGVTWFRYWVEFEGGRWLGSITESKLVRAKDWEDFQRRRAEEAARPQVEQAPVAEAAASESAGDGAAASGAASKIPAHLLERSKRARERKSAGG